MVAHTTLLEISCHGSNAICFCYCKHYRPKLKCMRGSRTIFFRGGPNLIVCFVSFSADKGKEDPNLFLAGKGKEDQNTANGVSLAGR